MKSPEPRRRKVFSALASLGLLAAGSAQLTDAEYVRRAMLAAAARMQTDPSDVRFQELRIGAEPDGDGRRVCGAMQDPWAGKGWRAFFAHVGAPERESLARPGLEVVVEPFPTLDETEAYATSNRCAESLRKGVKVPECGVARSLLEAIRDEQAFKSFWTSTCSSEAAAFEPIVTPTLPR